MVCIVDNEILYKRVMKIMEIMEINDKFRFSSRVSAGVQYGHKNEERAEFFQYVV